MLEGMNLNKLKTLTYTESIKLCHEIRRFMISTVSKTGGHLASNLGTVELTIALHRVFDSPNDKIIWDVGHQSYTHKILTGRYKKFNTLRHKNGISGFPKPDESPHDHFISGHSSTAVSVACGLSDAMQLAGNRKNYAIAVVGDGAMTGGQFYEGLNNAGKNTNSNIIVILNHNGMSISKNVGAIAKYLQNIRHSENYISAKQNLENILINTPYIGKHIIKLLKNSKDLFKDLLHLTNMFENMGYVYLGPVDGHNLVELEKVLRAAKTYHHPVFIHVNTKKGKGYSHAENNPGEYHGIGAFDIKTGLIHNNKKQDFTTVFGKELSKIAADDSKICAVTAAMKSGVGLNFFDFLYPERFFDVGIAEQHAVTFAASLASTGKIPVFAVYSSFLQRAYDQIWHDVSISNLHIVLAIDRAGLVGEDGETHNGIFDVNMLLTIPNITIYSPYNYNELRVCLKKAIYEDKGIACVRYPRGKEETSPEIKQITNKKTVVLTYGRLYSELKNLPCEVIHLVKIYPVSHEFVASLLKYQNILFVEESYAVGGIADYFGSLLLAQNYTGCYIKRAINGFVKQMTVKQGYEFCNIDYNHIFEVIKDLGYSEDNLC